MSKIDRKRLDHLLSVRDMKYAALRAAMERARDARARLASARAARQANTAQLEMATRVSEIEGLKRLLRENDDAISALDASMRDALDTEVRASDEWRAAARLAESCERHCTRHGVPLPVPVEIQGPDLAPNPNGVVR